MVECVRNANVKQYVLFSLFSIVDNRLYDKAQKLKGENLKLSVEIEQLRAGSALTGGVNNSAVAARISQLENKLLAKQEELTELHKHKAENSQLIIDLGGNVEKLNKQLVEKELR